MIRSKTISSEKSLAIFFRISLGIVLLFAAAQIYIPIKPIPVTMHTIGITLISFMYKPKEASITTLCYLLLGLIGLPMFSNFNSGLSYFTGVTGGYLIGFLLAAPLMSFLIRSLPVNSFCLLLSTLIGHLIIYILGVGWLSTFIGINSAIYSGFLIYIPTGIIKIVITTFLLSFIKKD